jgi:hypothetical protein
MPEADSIEPLDNINILFIFPGNSRVIPNSINITPAPTNPTAKNIWPSPENRLILLKTVYIIANAMQMKPIILIKSIGFFEMLSPHDP